MATSSLTLRNRKSVHPTVAHTVESLLLEERTRWAIHIHDGLTQSVTSAVLELQGLQHRIRTEPEDVLATLHEVEVAIRNDLRHIRQILFELDADTPHNEPPLASFVNELVERWHLPARVSIEGELDRIPDRTLETANAIVAEATSRTPHSTRPGPKRWPMRLSTPVPSRYRYGSEPDSTSFGSKSRIEVTASSPPMSTWTLISDSA